jgi:hypothetical protein
METGLQVGSRIEVTSTDPAEPLPTKREQITSKVVSLTPPDG